jgi:hypothetical protein
VILDGMLPVPEGDKLRAIKVQGVREIVSASRIDSHQPRSLSLSTV